MNDIFGCDIGNGYGYISVLENENTDPVVLLPSKISKEGMPTSAYVASSSEIEVFSGRSAIDKYGSRNANKLVHAIKTRMVEGTINVGGIFVNTDDIYAAIVRDLVILGNEARQSMGKEKIYDLVFTFPASIANDITMINRMQNSIEKNIVDGHKLHVVSRLPEPAAVAVDYLYYMRNIVEINKRIVKDEYSILVYDLGHGTFDIALVSIKGNETPQLLIKDGIANVGGKNIDEPEQKMDVAKFVSNDNNSVVLHLDGSVEVYGDNSYGQCDIGKIKEATFIALSSTCVFVVDSDKNIQVFGSLPQKTKDVVKKWRKVEKLVVSDSLIVSIDSSKKIRVAELTDGLVSTIKNIEGWNNVKKICVYKDVCVALFEDGKIAMTPYNDSYNEIQTWKNISDIVFDGTYVAGLSLDGTIKLAGKCKSTILDAGRKEVGSWTDIVSICCSNYAFGGYDKKGRLHLTGKFGGKVEQLIEEWSENVHVE